MARSIEPVADVESYACHACGGTRVPDHGPGCECQCEVLIAKESPAAAADPTG